MLIHVPPHPLGSASGLPRGAGGCRLTQPDGRESSNGHHGACRNQGGGSGPGQVCTSCWGPTRAMPSAGGEPGSELPSPPVPERGAVEPAPGTSMSLSQAGVPGLRPATACCADEGPSQPGGLPTGSHEPPAQDGPHSRTARALGTEAGGVCISPRPLLLPAWGNWRDSGQAGGGGVGRDTGRGQAPPPTPSTSTRQLGSGFGRATPINTPLSAAFQGQESAPGTCPGFPCREIWVETLPPRGG